MTDSPRGDTPAESFDFETAVAAARRDYPAETSNASFIDAAQPDGRAKLVRWWEDSSEDFRFDNDLFIFMTEDSPQCTGDKETNRKLMIFSSDYESPVTFGLTSRRVRQGFTFNHELGHIVANHGLSAEQVEGKDGNSKDVHVRAEIVADCFGILRSLAQKIITREDARRLTFWRGIAGGTKHATAQAVDALLQAIEDKKIDPAKLTLEEIKSTAAVYAEKYAPTRDESAALDLSCGYEFFHVEAVDDKGGKRERTNEGWLENMADVCEKKPMASYAFYAAAKTLSVILATGKEPFTGKKFDVTDKKWDEVRKKLKERAEQSGARHLLFKAS